MSDERLGKQDRLKKRKVIQQVFAKGTPVKGYPVLILSTKVISDGPKPVRAGFSVPKRKVRRAVDRNLIKRRMKEAYRLNKHLVKTEEDDQQLALMCIYMTSELLTFNEIENGMVKALKRLNRKYA